MFVSRPVTVYRARYTTGSKTPIDLAPSRGQSARADGGWIVFQAQIFHPFNYFVRNETSLPQNLRTGKIRNSRLPSVRLEQQFVKLIDIDVYRKKQPKQDETICVRFGRFRVARPYTRI